MPFDSEGALERSKISDTSGTGATCGTFAAANQTDRRKAYLDYLRIAATLAVVCAHTSAPFYSVVGAVGTPVWWLANVMDGFSRWPVPIFVMISGAVLVGRRSGVTAFYRRIMPRLLIPALFWNLFYLGFGAMGAYSRHGDALWTLKFGLLTSGGSFYHLWYMATFPALMLLVPFANKLLHGDALDARETLGLVVVLAFFASLNQASSMLQTVSGYEIAWIKGVPWFLGYFLLGYWIDRNADLMKIPKAAPLPLAIALTIIGLAANFGVARRLGIADDAFIFNFYGGVGFVIAVLIFLHVRLNASAFRPRAWVTTGAEATFGVYLIHPAFLHIFKWVAPGLWERPLIALPLSVAAATIASFATIILLRRFAAFRRLC